MLPALANRALSSYFSTNRFFLSPNPALPYGILNTQLEQIGGVCMVISYQRLWKLLEERHITRKELARRAGISETTVRNMVAGQNVSLDVLGKICGALHVDLGDIAQFVRA